MFLYGSILFILGCGGGSGKGGELNEGSVPDDVLRSPFVPASRKPPGNELTTCSFNGADGTKNLAPAVSLTAGAEGDWNEFDGELPPPLLKVSTYLDGSESL